ncbi:TetR/AcrR family transcriptional regulator [Paenibacillus farraposensis]|uniref:TetR/AcrR family transcriptional regulator n=1 Tax=Paenibacillus farraposensis TaxID=2807095 RepID=A0ABW4DEQ1_9BACL|nr:TetR/AcrR family transcriptional regulator [Paenibacillus farraposensis]
MRSTNMVNCYEEGNWQRMFDKFLNLEPEKQERILNAAMKEFAQKGYKHASTNDIVAEAKISKGLLFHYFQNKKELFLFLNDFIMDHILNEFFAKIDLNETDLFLRIKQFVTLKIEVINKHPEMFNFLLAARTEDAPEVKAELDRRDKSVTASGQAKLFENLDFSQFQEGIDIDKAINILMWTMEGISNREKEKAVTNSLIINQKYYDEIVSEMDGYIELFKSCWYRKPEKES